MATAPLPPIRRDARQRQIEHELDLVQGAIALVTRGDARRVSLVVHNGTAILPVAQAEGRRRGVIVRAAWHSGRADCDLIVEPIG